MLKEYQQGIDDDPRIEETYLNIALGESGRAGDVRHIVRFYDDGDQH